MRERQATLAREVTYEGVGIHTGETCHARFRPAPPGAGIRFVRIDLPDHPEIPVAPENAVYDTRQGRRTILRSGEAEVHTVEHLLAAVAGVGIDNIRIELDAREPGDPGDGSAAKFVELLLSAGREEQDEERRYLDLHGPVRFQRGIAELIALPHPHLRLSVTIEYPQTFIGTQHAAFDVVPEVFAREIAPARTFVLQRDVDRLRAAGLIQGGSLENAILVDDNRVVNEGGLRFQNEFVRHKVLDLLGDLFLLGRPLLGHVSAVRSGHESHVAFVKRLKETLPLPGRRAGAPADEWDTTAIMDIMPHRYPFLLVDRITRIEEGESIEGIKNVTVSEPFFQGHFPGHPIMPAVLILEAMAQVGGLLLLNSVDDPNDKLMYFMGIDGARFRRPVTPGDQLRFKLTLLKLKGTISKMKGEAYVDDQLVAEAELLATVVDKRPS